MTTVNNDLIANVQLPAKPVQLPAKPRPKLAPIDANATNWAMEFFKFIADTTSTLRHNAVKTFKEASTTSHLICIAISVTIVFCYFFFGSNKNDKKITDDKSKGFNENDISKEFYSYLRTTLIHINQSIKEIKSKKLKPVDKVLKIISTIQASLPKKTVATNESEKKYLLQINTELSGLANTAKKALGAFQKAADNEHEKKRLEFIVHYQTLGEKLKSMTADLKIKAEEKTV